MEYQNNLFCLWFISFYLFGVGYIGQKRLCLIKNKMTKEDFINIFNEKPEDVLGNNWENLVENYLSVKYNERREELINHTK